MSNVAVLEKPTRLEQFRMDVLPPERKQDLFASLPAHVRPEVFERNLVNALMQNPNLMMHDPRLVFREVSKAAALGLYLDPQLGEGYLIESYNGKTRQKEPQLRIGYRGLVKLGRQSGQFTIMYAHEVHANDTFRCVLGTNKSLVHEPDVFGDRGDIIGYYAVVKYHDGEIDFEPLTVKQAQDIRDRSDGWKAFKAEKIRSTPWASDEVEMSKKTAIRKLCKRLPQSPELAQAFSIEDEAEHSEMRSVPAAPQLTVPPAPKLQAKTKAEPRGRTAEPYNRRAEDAETVVEDGKLEAQAPVDPDKYLDDLEGKLAGAKTLADIDEILDEFTADEALEFPPDTDKAEALFDLHRDRLTLR